MEDGPKPAMFTLKKWNAVAMWSWDVQCDKWWVVLFKWLIGSFTNCFIFHFSAICRVQIMGKSQCQVCFEINCTRKWQWWGPSFCKAVRYWESRQSRKQRERDVKSIFNLCTNWFLESPRDTCWSLVDKRSWICYKDLIEWVWILCLRRVRSVIIK